MIAYEEIEAVAKAIFCADDGVLEHWGSLDQGRRNYYLRLARDRCDEALLNRESRRGR